MSVDPMAKKYPNWSPYCYTLNNPILLIDPNGEYVTKYKDENGRILLNTNDGSKAVVTITDDKRPGFDKAVKGTKDIDNPEWNNTLKNYALGFELSAKQESLLNSMNSDWSRSAVLKYWQTGDVSAGSSFALKEVFSQWTNPDLVATGLTAGVAGYSGMMQNAAKIGKNTPSFIVSEGGTTFPVPKGATGPIQAASGKGFQFIKGAGGNGLNPKVTGFRFMNPVTTGKYQYPSGYGSYFNKAGQTINPFNGQTISTSNPWWHIPAK